MTNNRGRSDNLGAGRWFRFGPGLLLAIIASVVVWQRQPLRRDAPVRTVPEAGEYVNLSQPDTTSEADRPLPAAPDPDWLLSQRKALSLNAAQTRRLSALHARWQRDTRELRAMLTNASQQFQRDMANERKDAVTLQVLSERAAPVAELSQQLAQARRAWWSEAAQVLSAVQRRRAETAWSQHFALKPVAAEKSGNTEK